MSDKDALTTEEVERTNSVTDALWGYQGGSASAPSESLRLGRPLGRRDVDPSGHRSLSGTTEAPVDHGQRDVAEETK